MGDGTSGGLRRQLQLESLVFVLVDECWSMGVGRWVLVEVRWLKCADRSVLIDRVDKRVSVEVCRVGGVYSGVLVQVRRSRHVRDQSGGQSLLFTAPMVMAT